ncbi:MAG: TIGR03621 family F420-dependent LLM class oxidoreductase [Thermomicrobiales bacterium]
MSDVKPFRFGVQSRSAGPHGPWLETVRRIEALGYDTLMWPDHFVRGFEPVAAMAAAAMVTEKLKVCGFVFDNDFRHPVVLAMSIGSIDVLSGGRVELGIGAGWLKDEYGMSGIPFDPVSVRIARLEEAIQVLKRLLSGEKTRYQGEFYAIDGLRIPPAPVQKPYPPLIIGGGSPKILRLAAREADIVGITTRALPDGSKDDADMTAAATDRKIEWVREAAGDRFSQIELNTICPIVEITDDRRGVAERLAADLPVSAEEVLDSPTALIGTVDEIAEILQERRERYGFSYVVVLEPVVEAFAPVVERLTGR